MKDHDSDFELGLARARTDAASLCFQQGICLERFMNDEREDVRTSFWLLEHWWTA